MSKNTLCPYCGYEFDTLYEFDRHIPCPSEIGDTHPYCSMPADERKESDENNQ